MDEPKRISGAWLALIAIGIGISVVGLITGTLSLLAGRSLNLAEEWAAFLFLAVVVAVPFLILALMGARTRLPWLVGLALTLAFYAYVLFEGVSSQWNPDGSGANIGLGILAIFVVPPLISAACIAAYTLEKRSRTGEPTVPASRGGRPLGCLAALAIGALIAVLVNGASSLLNGEPPSLVGWPVFLPQALMAAIPFGLLAIAGIRSRLPWLVGLALTLAFWGYFVFEVVSMGWNPDRPVHFDMLMIVMVSPLIISIACFGAHAWQRRSKPTGK